MPKAGKASSRYQYRQISFVGFSYCRTRDGGHARIAIVTMASNAGRGVPSRASPDMPCVRAMTSPARPMTSASDGSTPSTISRSIRLRSRASMAWRIPAISRCTSTEAAEPLAVALREQTTLGRRIAGEGNRCGGQQVSGSGVRGRRAVYRLRHGFRGPCVKSCSFQKQLLLVSEGLRKGSGRSLPWRLSGRRSTSSRSRSARTSTLPAEGQSPGRTIAAYRTFDALHFRSLRDFIVNTLKFVDLGIRVKHTIHIERYESINMSLTNYRTLGRSGLVVSPLALGTMTFGSGGWGATEAMSRAIFNAYRDAGGNFIDTADIYTGGESETMVGRFIAETGSRDDIVLATKFAFNGSSSPLTATQAGGGNPNAGGAGAKNIHRAIDASLKRLGTDYIDLYWMHIWDGVTPTEEIVQTLGDLVRLGEDPLLRTFGYAGLVGHESRDHLSRAADSWPNRDAT